jgi:hypothetical protein
MGAIIQNHLIKKERRKVKRTIRMISAGRIIFWTRLKLNSMPNRITKEFDLLSLSGCSSRI